MFPHQIHQSYRSVLYENSLDKPKDTEFKIINLIKDFKEDTNKDFTELQEDNNKCLSYS